MKHLHKLTIILSITLIGLLWGSSAMADKIYKTTRADGSVVYTDQPPTNPAPGDTIEVVESAPTSTNTFSSQSATTGDTTYQPWIVDDTGREITPGVPPSEPSFEGYTQFTITTPDSDQAIRSNPGNVRVATELRPALQPGHSITLLLNGRRVENTTNYDITLTNVDRGTHRAVAVVEDTAGRPLITSDPVTFHILRAIAPALKGRLLGTRKPAPTSDSTRRQTLRRRA